MNNTAPTYALLRKLYLGSASIVERLSDDERDALMISTPLFEFFSQVQRGEERRHVVLTGNAGDGKTFTTLRAFTPRRDGLRVIHDASGLYSAGEDPIHTLGDELRAALTRGDQLIVAINRGQLERLYDRFGADAHLGALLERARAQLALAPFDPSARDDDEVAVIDLGLLDTLSPEILTPAIDKLLSAQVGEGVCAARARSFEAAQRALSAAHVRASLEATLSRVRATGAHVTMRQLWSYLGYLMTGGVDPTDDRGISVHDAIGARMFAEEAQGLLFQLARAVDDPAKIPNPALTRALVSGEEARADAFSAAGLRDFIDDGERAGAATMRALSVHAAPHPSRRARDHQAVFGALLGHLRGVTWWSGDPQTIKALLNGIYKGLGLPLMTDSPWLWRRLCYDASRWDQAPLLSNMKLDMRRLKLGCPYPCRATQRALGAAWRPPFIWIAYVNGDDTHDPLRLDPALFETLLSDEPTLKSHERRKLWSWLSRLRGERQPREVHVTSALTTRGVKVSKSLLDERARYTDH